MTTKQSRDTERPAAEKPHHLVSGKTLARSMMWSFTSTLVPLLLALVTVPFLLRGLGTDRFGLFTLAVIIIGYVSIFDLGLGRALTKLVADHLAHDEDHHELPPLIWTAFVMMFGIGGFVGIFLAISAPWVIGGLLPVSPDIAPEATTSLLILSAALPVVICSTGLRGVLESFQRFDLVCAVRIVSASATYLAPLAAVQFTSNLAMAVAAMAMGRVITAVMNLVFCTLIVPELRRDARFIAQKLAPLARFGGWLTVSNVIAPLLTYLDRFLVGGMISTAAIAYYGTPYDIVTRLWIIPWALTGVLFPAFATSVRKAPDRAQALFLRGVTYTFIAMFPAAILLVAFAGEGLTLWLGADFARHAAPVVRWLAAGVFVNALAQIASTLVQGTGRADIGAKLNLVELPIYVFVVWWLTAHFGIKGTAIAWTVRVTLDGTLLFLIGTRLVGIPFRRIARIGAAAGLALLAFGVASLPLSLEVKAAGCLFGLSAFAIIAWQFVLTPGERTLILSLGRST